MKKISYWLSVGRYLSLVLIVAMVFSVVISFITMPRISAHFYPLYQSYHSDYKIQVNIVNIADKSITYRVTTNYAIDTNYTDSVMWYYEIYLFENVDGQWELISIPPDPITGEGSIREWNKFYTISNLKPGTSYHIDVYTKRLYCTGFCWTEIYNHAGFTTLQGTPMTPSNFQGSNITTSSVTLSWDQVNNAESYELKRDGVVVYTGPNTTFNDANLMYGTSYEYSVVAKNASGSSAPASLIVTTLSTPPSPIPLIGNVTESSFVAEDTQVSYDPNFVVERQFKIYEYGSGTPLVTSSWTTDSTYSFTGLDPNKRYTVEIVARYQ